MSAARPVLVTGGSGFLGRHLVARLLTEGREVRVACRNPDAALSKAGARCFEASVLDHKALAEALKDCTAVFHLAGRVSRDPRDASALRALHVEGTRCLLEQTAQAGIKRVVYLSTSGTIACSRDPLAIASEETPYPWKLCQRWPYYRSKIEAEMYALSAAETLRLDLICLNPSLLLGPGDLRGSSTGDVLQVMQRQLPAIPSGGVNFVDVRDVAAAAQTAETRGRPGARYLLGGVNWSLRAFISRVGALAEVPVPRVAAPNLLTRWAARGLSGVYGLFGKPPPLDPVSVEMSQVFWYFSSALAQAELDFKPRAPDQTLLETIADLRQRHSL